MVNYNLLKSEKEKNESTKILSFIIPVAMYCFTYIKCGDLGIIDND